MSDAQPEVMALAGGFPSQGHADWRTLAAKVVNRSRPAERQLSPELAEDSLRSHLPGDLVIEPLYLAPRTPRALGTPGQMPYTRGRTMPDDHRWDIRSHHDHPDAAVSRRAVADDLEHGVTSVWVKLGGDGIDPADLSEVLADVRLDLTQVSVLAWDDQVAAAHALLGVLRAAKNPAGGNLGHDPIGACARYGASPTLDHLAGAVRAAQELPGVSAICVDSRVYHDTGAAAPDELGIALATAVAYLRRLEEDGIPVEAAASQIQFRVAASDDQFLTIAILRALRRLWARVCEVSAVPAESSGAYIHAVTSLRMLTRDDPFVNILRSTIATFAAAVGGADAITVLPHDWVSGLPDAFSRRLARNTQIVLAEEANIARVADPAGGSWYVEALTDELARKAWESFQDLERGGGVIAALANGTIADLIAEARAETDELVATRRKPITGVSMFPNPDEKPLERTARIALPAGEGALRPRRDSTSFEQLRDRAADFAAVHGSRPAVALRPLGDARTSGARETFVRNLLAVAGIDTVGAGDNAAVVILASSAKGYAEHAAAAITAARAAGAERLLVAGRAKELGDLSSQVDGEIYDGMDVVAFLGDLLTRLGAPEKGVQA